MVRFVSLSLTLQNGFSQVLWLNLSWIGGIMAALEFVVRLLRKTVNPVIAVIITRNAESASIVVTSPDLEEENFLSIIDRDDYNEFT